MLYPSLPRFLSFFSGFCPFLPLTSWAPVRMAFSRIAAHLLECVYSKVQMATLIRISISHSRTSLLCWPNTANTYETHITTQFPCWLFDFISRWKFPETLRGCKFVTSKIYTVTVGMMRHRFFSTRELMRIPLCLCSCSAKHDITTCSPRELVLDCSAIVFVAAGCNYSDKFIDGGDEFHGCLVH